MQPRRAASTAAMMSIFLIVILTSNARSASARSGQEIAWMRLRGVICQFNPHLSFLFVLAPPARAYLPPLPEVAFHKRSVLA